MSSQIVSEIEGTHIRSFFMSEQEKSLHNSVKVPPKLAHPWQRVPLFRRLTNLLTADADLRRCYSQSRRLLRSQPYPDNVIAAANVFQVRGLFDEAVVILLHYGFVDQAAGVYLALNNPERAGQIYASAMRWEKAALCFARARQYTKAAQCAVSIRDFAGAAGYFTSGGSLADAAQCWFKAGELGQSFKLYVKLGDLDNASVVLKQWRANELENSIHNKLDGAGREAVAKLVQRGSIEGASASNPPEVAVVPPAEIEIVEGDFDAEYRPTWLEQVNQSAIVAGSLDVAAFFQRFSKIDRDELWRLGRVIDYKQGEVIVDFDDEPAGLYTVLEGDLGVCKDRVNSTVASDRVGARMSFGQFWAVMRTRSQVRILGNNAGRIHVIPRRELVEAFKRGDKEHAALRQTFMAALLEHLNGSIISKNV